MYFVVHFLKDNEVEVVHENWLEDDKTTCFWPPFKNSNKITKCVLKGAEPDKKWKKFKIRSMGSYDCYEKAREKATLAELTSCLETEDSDREKEKSRKRRRRIFSGGSGSGSGSESQSLLAPRRPDLPEPPLITYGVNVASTPRMNPSTSFHHMPLMQSASITSTPSISYLMPSTPNLLTPFEKQVLTKFEDLKRSIEDINIRLNALVPKPDLVEDTKLPFSFPLDTDGELKTFEEYLKDPSNFSRSVKVFGSKGGMNVPSTTRRILSSLMTNNLAKGYNWAGKPPKKAFKQLKAFDLVLYAVRDNNLLKSANSKEVEDTIKQWLKYATFRESYKNKKDC